MVIFYDIETKRILRTEDYVMTPTIPVSETEEDKIAHYTVQGESFIALPYEIGNNIFNYKLCFNQSDDFIGLAPKINEN